MSVAVEVIESPLGPRIAATGVWTGSEVIVWGGWGWDGDSVEAPHADGASYDPASDTWRMLPAGPLSGRARHLAVWTGREMLIWGGFTSIDQNAPPDGAAYDPATGRWRTIAPAPITFKSGEDGVWADGEWIIAVARPRTSFIRVVAYSPDRDAWRELPRIPQQLSDESELTWTGSELLLMNAADGLYRLANGASAWTKASRASESMDSVVWAGDRLIGLRTLDAVSVVHSWDSATDTWPAIAEPSLSNHQTATLIWTGSQILLIGPGQAYDPSADLWSELEPPPALQRSESVVVWADDRLLELGGWNGGPGAELPFGTAYIPAW